MSNLLLGMGRIIAARVMMDMTILAGIRMLRLMKSPSTEAMFLKLPLLALLAGVNGEGGAE